MLQPSPLPPAKGFLAWEHGLAMINKLDRWAVTSWPSCTKLHLRAIDPSERICRRDHYWAKRMRPIHKKSCPEKDHQCRWHSLVINSRWADRAKRSSQRGLARSLAVMVAGDGQRLPSRLISPHLRLFCHRFLKRSRPASYELRYPCTDAGNRVS